MGDLAGGVRLMRESLSRYQENLGDKHLNTVITMSNLARQLSESGGGVEAESLAKNALSHLDSANVGARPHYIATLRVLGTSELAQGRVDDALPILARALDMAHRDFGDDHLRTAHARLSYGSALLAKGRVAEATPLLRAADAYFAKHRADQPRLGVQSVAAITALNARAK
jgi:tetratricopeptide (TPR) repeat protein